MPPPEEDGKTGHGEENENQNRLDNCGCSATSTTFAVRRSIECPKKLFWSFLGHPSDQACLLSFEKFRTSSRNLWKLTSIVFLGLAKRSLFYSKANLTTGSFIWLTVLVDIFQIFCLIDKTSFLQQYIVFFVVFDNKRQSAFCHPIIVLTRSGFCSLKYFKGISREICGKNISSPLSSFFSIQLVKKPFDNLLAFQNCFLLPPVGRLQT